MLSHKIICIPQGDTHKRFLLGCPGDKTLLAIGLNPSTANAQKLDPTSRNIAKIAHQNGFDGWWLVNLYPRRTPKPALLPKRRHTALANENIQFIEALLQDSSYNIFKVLCCWGNHVDTYSYLKQQAQLISKLLKKYNQIPLCMGLTSKSHPFHPAPMSVNRFLGGIKNVQLEKMIL